MYGRDELFMYWRATRELNAQITLSLAQTSMPPRSYNIICIHDI